MSTEYGTDGGGGGGWEWIIVLLISVGRMKWYTVLDLDKVVDLQHNQ